MAVTLDDKLVALPADRRAKVERRTAEIVEEELTLRQLRQAHARTQVDALTTWRGPSRVWNGARPLVSSTQSTGFYPRTGRPKPERGRSRRGPALLPPVSSP